MKKILIVMMILILTLIPLLSIAQEVMKCTIPKGSTFSVFHIRMGPVALISSKDQQITILEIRNVTNPRNPQEKKDVARFSLTYDKPNIICQEHGEDTFEVYKNGLGTDHGFVFVEILECPSGI